MFQRVPFEVWEPQESFQGSRGLWSIEISLLKWETVCSTSTTVKKEEPCMGCLFRICSRPLEFNPCYPLPTNVLAFRKAASGLLQNLDKEWMPDYVIDNKWFQGPKCSSWTGSYLTHRIIKLDLLSCIPLEIEVIYLILGTSELHEQMVQTPMFFCF